MSFKLKYKDKEDVEVELDFEQVAFNYDGNFILTGEDKVTGKFYRFIWRAHEYYPLPVDFPPANPN